jgi:hypothetical protein
MIRTVFKLHNDITDQVMFKRLDALRAENERLTRLLKQAHERADRYLHALTAMTGGHRRQTVAEQHARYFGDA